MHHQASSIKRQFRDTAPHPNHVPTCTPRTCVRACFRAQPANQRCGAVRGPKYCAKGRLLRGRPNPRARQSQRRASRGSARAVWASAKGSRRQPQKPTTALKKRVNYRNTCACVRVVQGSVRTRWLDLVLRAQATTSEDISSKTL